MAEIGLIASVIQVAGAGLTLSNTLYQYANSVSSADKRIRDIAQDVKLTSFVIDELGRIFKQDETTALISKNAVNTAEETVRECSNVFTEMEAALKKFKKNTLGRLMLPFREPKLELLRTNIDRLKSTLQLLMQVLTHAHQIATQWVYFPSLAVDFRLIYRNQETGQGSSGCAAPANQGLDPDQEGVYEEI